MRAAVKQLAPQFEGKAFFNNEFKHLALNDFKNRYLVLFFYPLNFTFVCPTEIIQFSNKAKEFREKLNCDVVGCSVDSEFSHRVYVNMAREQGGLGGLDIPLLSDSTHQISKDYGVFHNDGKTLRGTYIIDEKQVLRHISINDRPVGRSVEEVYRLVQAFQFADQHGEVCPASWKPGDSTLKDNHNSEQTQTYWRDVFSKK